jgi:hypothetical protein
MVKIKWPPFCFLPFENLTRHFLSSLDRIGMNKIFFYDHLLIKRSRLANRTRMSSFRMVRYSNARDWHKIQSEYRQRLGIRWVTVDTELEIVFSAFWLTQKTCTSSVKYSF